MTDLRASLDGFCGDYDDDGLYGERWRDNGLFGRYVDGIIEDDNE